MRRRRPCNGILCRSPLPPVWLAVAEAEWPDAFTEVPAARAAGAGPKGKAMSVSLMRSCSNGSRRPKHGFIGSRLSHDQGRDLVARTLHAREREASGSADGSSGLTVRGGMSRSHRSVTKQDFAI
jgi:hypothetical protein